MVLKLVDTRIQKNNKFEVYNGVYLGHSVEAIKIYARLTVHHKFKLAKEIFRCGLSVDTYASIDIVKAIIKSNFDNIKDANGNVQFLEKEG